MTEATDSAGQEKPQKVEVPFHQRKSPDYRVIHVDGMISGFTPQGSFQVTVYSERFAIPQTVVHDIVQIADGEMAIGAEKREKRVSIDGVVRILDATLMMTEDSARALHAVLGKALFPPDQESAGE